MADATEQSFHLDSGVFERSGLSFPYERYTAPRKREAIVVLHGFAQSLNTWRPIAEALAEKYDVFLLCQRGYAKTNSPERTKWYRVAELQLDVIGLLDAEKLDKVHVVGHDLGGMVAWNLARERPERVASLTVISIPDARAVREALADPKIYKLWYILAFQLPGFGELITGYDDGRIAAKLLERTGLRPQLARQYVEEVRSISRWRSRIFCWYKAYWYNLSETRSSTPISAGTLIVWGDADPIVRRRTIEGSTKWISGCHLIKCIKGAGHWLPEDEPQRLAYLISAHVNAETI